MFTLILRWITAIMIAFTFGKLVSKLKLPSILGWLIGGMVLGPYALALLPNELIGATWYENIIHVLECAVDLMIGTELVWKRIHASLDDTGHDFPAACDWRRNRYPGRIPAKKRARQSDR